MCSFAVAPVRGAWVEIIGFFGLAAIVVLREYNKMRNIDAALEAEGEKYHGD